MALVYVSMDHDDAAQVRALAKLRANAAYELRVHERVVVVEPGGKGVRVRPTDPRAAPVKAAIGAQLAQCARLVVLIGDTTESHPWIEWEVRSFFEQKVPLAGPQTWRRIRGMRLKGTRGGDPAALAGRATVTLDWSPAALGHWIASPL
ncbi:MAG: TIR domain-containing protein [Myxococcales bacterium]|nr:TIR domain-containing protein [Myxococcales bacterium]